jgi:hypothetical protein
MQRLLAAGARRVHQAASQAAFSSRQAHRQTGAQARQAHRQTARKRSSPVKWRTASRQPQKQKWNNTHDSAWYTGKDSKLKMRNNMADEATAIHTGTMCMT